MSLTVREIVNEYLKANGYDGLASPRYDCGCEVGDLMPCDYNGIEDCEPGHRVPCEGGDDCPAEGDCDWHMVAGKRLSESVLLLGGHFYDTPNQYHEETI